MDRSHRGQDRRSTAKAIAIAMVSIMLAVSVTSLFDDATASDFDINLYGMGTNGYGQQGTDGGTDVVIPTQIGSDLGAIAKVVCSSNTTFFLTSDGKLYGTGRNINGQQGDGTTDDVLSPKHIGSDLGTIADVVCSNTTTFFLTSDGKLYGMGANGYGQQGDGTTANVLSPKQIGSELGTIAKVICSSNMTFFITSDGKLYGMGFNGYGQQGDGTTDNVLSPKQIGADLGTIATVTCAPYNTTFFLTSDGKLYGMGANGYGQQGTDSGTNVVTPTQIGADLGTIAKVVCTDPTTFFLTPDGHLYRMGNNNKYQLGTGGTSSVKTPTPFDSTYGTISDMFCSPNTSYFITSDGKLYGMGDNSDCQQGNGTTISVKTPAQIGSDLGTISYVACSDYTTFFTTSDGKLYGTGRNSNGQQGDDTTVKVTSFKRIGEGMNKMMTDIVCSGSTTFFLATPYTINIDANGGTFSNGITKALVGSDSSIMYQNADGEEKEFVEPTKTNAAFMGLCDSEGTKVIGRDGKLIKGVEGYTDADGKWIHGSGVSLIAEYGSVVKLWDAYPEGSANRSFIAAKDSATLAEYSAPVKTGHTFDGYYADTDREDQVIDSTGKYVLCSYSSLDYTRQVGDDVVWNLGTDVEITLYAKWTPVKYTVTVTEVDPSNIGTIAPMSFEADYNTEISFTTDQIWSAGVATITATIAADEHYTDTFSWSVTETFKLTGNVTIIGAFTRTPNDYPVTVSAGDHGGSASDAFAAPFGSDIVSGGAALSIGGKAVTAAPSTGYALKSWKLTLTGSGADYTGSTMPGEGITATAQWEPTQYSINLDANYAGGTGAAFTATYDSPELTDYSEPVRGAYTFGGYYAEKDAIHQVIDSDGNYVEYSGYTARSGDNVVWNNAAPPVTLYAKWTFELGYYKYVINYTNDAINSVDYYTEKGGSPTRITESKSSVWDFDRDTGYGPFNSCYKAIDMNTGEEAFILNPYNLKQKLDGSSYTAGNYNIVWYIPTVYWQVSGNSLVLSNDKDEGTAYAHTAEGIVYSAIGIGVYEASTASINGKTSLMSQTGKTPTVNTTIANFDSYAHNTPGTTVIWNFYQWTFTKMATYMVGMGKNTQQIWGSGNTNTSARSATGLGDMEGPYASGKTAYSKVFVENTWGSLWNYIGDTVISSGTLYMGQNLTGITYNNTNKKTTGPAADFKMPSNGWITATSKNARDWDLPIRSGSSSNAGDLNHPGDRAGQWSGVKLLRTGGHWTDKTNAGIAYSFADVANGTKMKETGTRIAYFFVESNTIAIDAGGADSDLYKAKVYKDNSAVSYSGSDGGSVSYSQPAKDGYTFNGFWTQTTGGVLLIDVSGALVPNVAGYTGAGGKWIAGKDVALFAQYSADSYTITLNENYEGAAERSFTATYDSATMDGYSAPTRGDYTFAGYYADQGTTMRVIGPSGQYVAQAGYTAAKGGDVVWQKPSDTTLYAKWIMLSAEGGTKNYDGAVPSLTVRDGDAVLTSNFTVKYYSDSGYTTEVPAASAKDAGTYYIKVIGNGDYQGTSATATSIINPKTLTLSPGTASIIMEYNTLSAVDRSFFSIDRTDGATIAATGLVGHEMPMVSEITANFYKGDEETSTVEADRVRITAITLADSTVPSGFKNSNYAIVFDSGEMLELVNGTDRVVKITTKHVALISSTDVMVVKDYDGTVAATVVAGTHYTLDHVVTGDEITITFDAAYDRSDVFATKVILTNIHLQGPSSENYEVNTRAELHGIIQKAIPGLSTAPAVGADLEYDGSLQELIATAGASAGGTVLYAVSSTEVADDKISELTFYAKDDDSVKRVDTGTYYVYYMIVGDQNHHDRYCTNTGDMAKLTAEIKKGVPFFTRDPQVSDAVYSGSPISLLVDTGSTDGGAITYAVTKTQSTEGLVYLEYGDDGLRVTDAGTYYVYYKIGGNDNYKEMEFPDSFSTAIVEKAEPVLTRNPDVAAVDHDGKAHDMVTVAGESEGLTVMYGISDTDVPEGIEYYDFGSKELKRTDLGDYYVFCLIIGNGNYADAVAGPFIASISDPDPGDDPEPEPEPEEEDTYEDEEDDIIIRPRPPQAATKDSQRMHTITICVGAIAAVAAACMVAAFFKRSRAQTLPRGEIPGELSVPDDQLKR